MERNLAYFKTFLVVPVETSELGWLAGVIDKLES
jgi:hypothetical protein